MRSLPSTPSRCIKASSAPSWLGVMNKDNSPGALKSVCAASSVTEARIFDALRASCAAAIDSSVPPMQ